MRVITRHRVPFYDRCVHVPYRVKYWLCATWRHERGIRFRYRQKPDGVMTPIKQKGNWLRRHYKVKVTQWVIHLKSLEGQ
jgi:hypothetical protein